MKPFVGEFVHFPPMDREEKDNVKNLFMATGWKDKDLPTYWKTTIESMAESHEMNCMMRWQDYKHFAAAIELRARGHEKSPEDFANTDHRLEAYQKARDASRMEVADYV